MATSIDFRLVIALIYSLFLIYSVKKLINYNRLLTISCISTTNWPPRFVAAIKYLIISLDYITFFFKVSYETIGL